MHYSILLPYASVAVTALAYPGPAPTQPGHVDLAVKGRSPIPTALARRSDPMQLFHRQDDRTCGYIDHDFGTSVTTPRSLKVSVSLYAENPITCSAGKYCAFDAQSASKVFGCCSGPVEDCLLQTTCYSSADLEASCDSSCQAYTENAIW